MKNVELILEKYKDTPFSFKWGNGQRHRFTELMGAKLLTVQFFECPDNKHKDVYWSGYVAFSENELWVLMYDANHRKQYYCMAPSPVQEIPLPLRRRLLDFELAIVDAMVDILMFAYEDEIRLEQL